mmetsp:Transcript_18250/g.52027  ORF Transcript_18250/g.52027 Transcript_18250/m.52027 type:complete len:146 (+) Transcript_18250:186-623(+)
MMLEEISRESSVARAGLMQRMTPRRLPSAFLPWNCPRPGGFLAIPLFFFGCFPVVALVQALWSASSMRASCSFLLGTCAVDERDDSSYAFLSAEVFYWRDFRRRLTRYESSAPDYHIVVGPGSTIVTGHVYVYPVTAAKRKGGWG